MSILPYNEDFIEAAARSAHLGFEGHLYPSSWSKAKWEELDEDEQIAWHIAVCAVIETYNLAYGQEKVESE